MTRRTLIGLHGLGAAKSAFDPLRVTALGRDHDLIAYDFPGFGARGQEPVTSTPVTDAAADIAALIRRENRRDVILLGHSMGGAVAVLAAGLVPDHIAAVVSLEGNLIAEDCGLLSRRLAGAADAADCAAMQQSLVASGRRSTRPAMRAWAETFALSAAPGLLAWSRDLVAHSDSGDLLRAFRAGPWRSLYLHGDDYVGHTLLSQLPPVPIVFIPGAGHDLMGDAPDATAAAVIDAVIAR